MFLGKQPPQSEQPEVVYDDGGTGLFDECMKRFAKMGWTIRCDAQHSVWVEKADGSYSVGVARGEVEQRGVDAALQKIETKMKATGQSERSERMKAEWSAKRQLVSDCIRSLPSSFTSGDAERACPEVARPTVTRVLRELSDAGEIRSVSRGRNAMWERVNRKKRPVAESGDEGAARQTMGASSS
ncbi:MAG: hypothetical protein HGB10_11795 [Coriobacteriia bacterium]|nr:hypothetical protein [Coriobacteriia bacterium]